MSDTPAPDPEARSDAQNLAAALDAIAALEMQVEQERQTNGRLRVQRDEWKAAAMEARALLREVNQ